jgi:hypothetical protein
MKRSSYLTVLEQYIPLGKSGLTVMGYGKKQQFVCRLYVNAAGVAVYSGKKGGRRLANVGWENLVQKLS